MRNKDLDDMIEEIERLIEKYRGRKKIYEIEFFYLLVDVRQDFISLYNNQEEE